MTDCKCDLGNILDEETFNLRVIRELCAVDKPIRGYQFIRMVDKTDDGDVQFLRTPVGDYLLDGETPYTPIGEVSVYKRSSGPGPEPLINDGKLRFTIDTSLDPDQSSSHLLYGFVCGSANSVSDYVIDWGDGTTTIGTNSHTYATEGTYQITVSAGASGNFPVCKLGASGSGSYKKVVSVDTPPDTFYNYTGEVGGTSFFRYCTNLTSVCSNFFANNSQMTLLNSLFENTSSLETIPEGFLDNLVNVVHVPTMFKNSGIKYLPNGLFRFNTKIYNFNECFNGCKNLALNKNIFCDEATESTTRFISPDIVTPSFFRTFYRTSFTGDTPGVAPSLWLYSYNDNRDASDSTCFSGAGNSTTSISNYNSIPSAWGGPA